MNQGSDSKEHLCSEFFHLLTGFFFQDQFQCRTGTCIWETYVCDNDFDCPGKEDEENCPQVKTCAALSEYQCRRSSGCIPSTLICDGHDDCADGYVCFVIFVLGIMTVNPDCSCGRTKSVYSYPSLYTKVRFQIRLCMSKNHV